MLPVQRHGLLRLLVIATGLSACSGAVVPNNEVVTLTGAGASFPAPLYQRWIGEYRREHPQITIAYNSVGSGEGVKRYLSEQVDFGASDTPLTEQQGQQFPGDRQTPLQIPMTGGLVVFAYNLPGATLTQPLRLSRKSYCAIVTGEITTWNHPQLVADNPNLKVPDLPLLFIHRADSSGTTALFTAHLQAACPHWTGGAANQVDWPAGISAQGNEGVAAQLQQTQGAIGYLPFSFAQDSSLPVATLENRAGQLIVPSPQTATAAFVGAEIPADLSLTIADPEPPTAYPIVGLTWLLLYGNYTPPQKTAALKDFVRWSLQAGDTYAEQLGYFPLPKDLEQQAIAVLETL